jgi:hypothetical protein
MLTVCIFDDREPMSIIKKSYISTAVIMATMTTVTTVTIVTVVTMKNNSDNNSYVNINSTTSQ